MKKLSVILMACLMALGMTQCKKETTPTTDTPEENGVRITLDLRSNSRVIVDPSVTGTDGTNVWTPVEFESGDWIYVGYNDAYVGYLEYNGSVFTGNVDISNADGTSPLHFYFLGGNGYQPSSISGNTVTVDISDQTKLDLNDKVRYPVISYGTSNQPYLATTDTYSATLVNKCSIMKFNVTKPTNANDAICIEGMNNTVTVNFANPNGDDNGFAYSMEDHGRIKMQGVTSTSATEPVDMWAIVLPQNALETTGNAYNVGKTCAGLRPEIPQIVSNKYMSSGIPMNLGDLGFSVSATKKIYFAPGNLQCKVKNYDVAYPGEFTVEWRFADHQYEYIGGTQWDLDNWIDLFGWGTWTGTANDWVLSFNKYKKPIRNDQHNESPSAGGYAWYEADFNNNIGINNNDRKDWRSLEMGELKYLLNSRTVSNGINARYAKATVNGVKGLILFPDHYAHPADLTVPAGINNTGAAFTVNNYNTNQWDEMEFAGAVFLPCAGCREVTAISYAGQYGYYWTCGNRLNYDDLVFHYTFILSTVNPESTGFNRWRGHSVRLVHE